MAYKTLPPRLDYPLTAFYNVDMAVGQNKANSETDVMLVQLCLQQIYAKPTLFRPPPEGYYVKADGKFGPITCNAIWWYQSELQRRGASVYPDGVVDKASDLDTNTPIGWNYSIIWCNYNLQRAIGPERFAHLEDDKICPPHLAVRLAASWI